LKRAETGVADGAGRNAVARRRDRRLLELRVRVRGLVRTRNVADPYGMLAPAVHVRDVLWLDVRVQSPRRDCRDVSACRGCRRDASGSAAGTAFVEHEQLDQVVEHMDWVEALSLFCLTVARLEGASDWEVH